MTSPFLPGTRIQFAWDATSLGWFKTCPRLYQYSMLEGWRANRESVHLTFGIHYHAALESYDRFRAQGGSHDGSLIQVIYDTMVATYGWSSDHPSKNRETLIRSIIWYCDQFADDPAETIVLASGRPAVELSFKMELDWGPTGHLGDQPYLLCGHIDRLVNFASGTYVTDRKTTGSTISSSYFEQYDPDNQMSLYTLAAQVIYKTPVQGVIIDAAQITVGFSRFARGLTYRTKAQTEEWLNDTRYWLGLAKVCAKTGRWPMNDRSCHLYGGCKFRSVCSKSPEVRHKFLETDFHQEPWNPLESR